MYRGERFNSISHLTGAGLAVAGGSSLITISALQGDIWKIIASCVYVAMLVLLYSSSTLYHSLRGQAKVVLQKIDHIAIYLLIAGSYTPFALVTLRQHWGWGLFASIWSLALFGILQELFFAKGKRILSLVIYAVMGWLVVFVAKPLTAQLPSPGQWWLLAGGLAYSGGIVFYVLDHRLRHSHGIWHLFVLAGSCCHFWCIYRYVIFTAT